MMYSYQFTNFRTRHFQFKSFENQPNFFILADVVLASHPTKVLTVVPLFGTCFENQVRDAELKKGAIPQELYEPFYGEFVHVPSKTPLYRVYTDDDAHVGLCSKRDIGTFVLNKDFSKRIFNTIRVFCIIDETYLTICESERLQRFFKLSEDRLFWESGDHRISRYLANWSPQIRARYKKNYCYINVKDVD